MLRPSRSSLWTQRLSPSLMNSMIVVSSERPAVVLPQGLEGSWSSPTVIQRAFDKLLSAKEKAYV